MKKESTIAVRVEMTLLMLFLAACGGASDSAPRNQNNDSGGDLAKLFQIFNDILNSQEVAPTMTPLAAVALPTITPEPTAHNPYESVMTCPAELAIGEACIFLRKHIHTGLLEIAMSENGGAFKDKTIRVHFADGTYIDLIRSGWHKLSPSQSESVITTVFLDRGDGTFVELTFDEYSGKLTIPVE